LFANVGVDTTAKQKIRELDLVSFKRVHMRSEQVRTLCMLIVFAAFVPGEGQEVARGGRYDQIGEVFGRARPATGFSADLKTLMRLGSFEPKALDGAVLAPADDDPTLLARIAELRAAGSVVIRELPGQPGNPAEMGCSHRLHKQAGTWDLIPL